MKPMIPDSAQRRELQRFGDMLRSCSPPREAHPEDPARQIVEIEQRAASITTHRHWLVATAGALIAGLVGLSIQGAEPPSVVAPVASKGQARRQDRVSLRNVTDVSEVVDLGICRLLLRPGCQASYDRARRTLHLEAGAVIAHVFPDGRGFRVELARQTVIVKGTLFGVDAASGKVDVWHGVVEQRDRRGGRERVRQIAGTEVFDDLTAEELRQLAFTPPKTVARTRAILPPTLKRPHPKWGRRSTPFKERVGTVADAGVAADAETDAATFDDPPKPAGPDRERQLLLRAQRGLARGRYSAALATLQHHVRQYPSSELAEEASLLRIRALVSLQHKGALRREVAQFLKRFPASAMAGQVRRLGEQLSQKR